MASGNDMRIGFSKETTYGTRVAPARFFAINGEDMGYEYGRYYSPALGMGRWTRPSVVTTKTGSGSFNGDVPTTGFGYLLNGLHGNTVTAVQQAATAAYLQTHTLDTAPTTKFYSVQIQTPPVGSSTLIPVDFTGVSFGGINFTWTTGTDGVLRYELTTVQQNLDTTQSLATYVAPTAWSPFSFQGGSIPIGGVAQTDIIGSGSLSIAFNLRDDAYLLGTGGTIAQPVETDKPTASGTVTADFQSITHLNRTINNTIADVNLHFDGAIIASTYKFYLDVTIPDCVFTNPRPTVSDPGPVSQTVNFSNASTAGNPVVIKYESTDTTL